MILKVNNTNMNNIKTIVLVQTSKAKQMMKTMIGTCGSLCRNLREMPGETFEQISSSQVHKTFQNIRYLHDVCML